MITIFSRVKMIEKAESFFLKYKIIGMINP